MVAKNYIFGRKYGTNLVAYYPLNSNANDFSGKGHNGSLVGSPTFTAGKISNAINFGNRIIYAVGGWAYYPTKPLISTKMQEQSFRFKQQYNVELIEGNSVNI